MIKLKCIAVLLLFPLLSNAANNDKLDLGLKISSGIEIGWWLFNRGVNENTGEHVGYGRTDLKLFIPVAAEFQVEIGNLMSGIGVVSMFLMDDEMEYSNYQGSGERQVMISNGAVSYHSIYGVFHYRLLELKKFQLGPSVKLGTFFINSSHPEKDEIKSRLFTEYSIPLYYVIDKLKIEISPSVSFLRGSTHAGQSWHKIYGFGIQYGIIWQIR